MEVSQIFNEFKTEELFAQTDDDAVVFYQKCGFQISKKAKWYENEESIRYDCALMT